MIPPAFRKVLRLLLDEMSGSGFFMTPPGTGECLYNNPNFFRNPRLIRKQTQARAQRVRVRSLDANLGLTVAHPFQGQLQLTDARRVPPGVTDSEPKSPAANLLPTCHPEAAESLASPRIPKEGSVHSALFCWQMPANS